MEKKITEISEIKTGYTVRGSILNYQGNQVGAIQAKDIIQGDFNNLNFIKIDNLENHLLQNGDVLLSIKGVFRANVFHELPHSTIATSSVAIFRVNIKQILPEYLALVLNSAIGQRQLSKIAIGSSIKALPITELKNLTIEVPDLSTQKFVISINKNTKAQMDLLKAKQQKLQQINTQLTDKIIKGDLS